jgi:hypothetical protein
MMKSKLFYAAALLTGVVMASSCSKNNDKTEPIPVYTVPTTYNFDGANYAAATARVKMGAELNSYLGTATTTTITVAKANDYFNNTNNPFAAAELNTSGVNLAAKTADAATFTGYFAQQASNSTKNNVTATNGTAGLLVSGTTKRLVSATGLEYNQAVAKGMMGALYFKEAVTILNAVPNDDNTVVTSGATAMQRHWDEAFGYLGVPKNYDTTKTYTAADLDRPLLWGGYLAERGKGIQAGGIIFGAFLKGRAAIGAKDYAVVKEQIAIIQDKWEQLAAAAALEYVTIPTRSVNVGNLATQFHALSEGSGFISCFKYRATRSKLSATDYATLQAIIGTNFYTLIAETNFTKLVQAQTILKTTYKL